MPDAEFSHLRLAAIYDPLDPDRSDLSAYVNLVEEFGAQSVLDVGCGTGTFACVHAEANDVTVLGVDPARASIEVARSKGASDRVEWIVATMSDVAAVPKWGGHFDLATMTANVAQVFVEDQDWLSTLRAIRACLRVGGHLAFETQMPADRAWERWTKELTRQVVDLPTEGPVERWIQTTNVNGGLVTFEGPTIFLADNERIDSTSTLRFRTSEDLRESLEQTGFFNIEIRDLPYAPARGWLVVAST